MKIDITTKEKKEIAKALKTILSQVQTKINEASQWVQDFHPVEIYSDEMETWYGWFYGKEFYVSCHRKISDRLTLLYSSQYSPDYGNSLYTKAENTIKWIDIEEDFMSQYI